MCDHKIDEEDEQYFFIGREVEDRSVSERCCAVQRARGMRAKGSGCDIRAATSRKTVAEPGEVPTPVSLIPILPINLLKVGISRKIAALIHLRQLGDTLLGL